VVQQGFVARKMNPGGMSLVRIQVERNAATISSRIERASRSCRVINCQSVSQKVFHGEQINQHLSAE
jgi:hypothetical protein